MTFEQDLQNVINILKDSNVSYQAKERIYNDFLEYYPYFDSSKLDNIIW